MKPFKLNPLLQINEFDRLNLCDPLSCEAQVLWFVFFRLFNRSGWPVKLTIKTKVLEEMCCLSRQKICVARESLITRSMIIYHEKSGSASPDYEFLCLYSVQSEHKIDDKTEHKSDTKSTQTGTTHIYNINKTKGEKKEEYNPQIIDSDFILKNSFTDKKYEHKPGGAPKKNKANKPVLFQDSPCSNKEYFLSQLNNTEYEAANLDYYHELILNWSNSQQSKKHNWIAFSKNWILKDYQAGKLVTLNNVNNGTSANQQYSGNAQSYTELGKSIDDYFEQKYNR